MTRRSAFSLLELLIALAILGGLTATLFVIFSMGSRSFQVGTGRADLQSDMRRVLTALRKDVHNSSFSSISTLDSQISVPQRPPAPLPTINVQRGAVCLNGLRRPQNPTSYDSDSGLPRWDCYIVYWATKDVPEGKLMRMLLRDDDGGVQGVPRDPFSAADLTSAHPSLLDHSVKELCDRLLAFRVDLDAGNQLVNINLKLRSRPGRQMGAGRSLLEVIEITSTVFPANTHPRL
ncbi:MAG: prepilin-type N-terminal cleavage/methylation domain-containing protein [Candidatus Eremiobacteraeota bacterium]|nr:prepilin-type N-terminal cleavage/methylation domain-containing protein [Candidatus Eremiobacteraeota bacterium]MCW5872452.1 prepilin-type N-terminal cleavage/methylation domain-containing protein [Candidatus Eremiobacteraeota bacterium]